jgi:hypothetical protein
LTFLLEALSEDIIAATDEEVRQVHGRSIAASAREVLRLIQAAREDKNEDLREDLGPDVCPSGAGPHGSATLSAWSAWRAGRRTSKCAAIRLGPHCLTMRRFMLRFVAEEI